MLHLNRPKDITQEEAGWLINIVENSPSTEDTDRVQQLLRYAESILTTKILGRMLIKEEE